MYFCSHATHTVSMCVWRLGHSRASADDITTLDEIQKDKLSSETFSECCISIRRTLHRIESRINCGKMESNVPMNQKLKHSKSNSSGWTHELNLEITVFSLPIGFVEKYRRKIQFEFCQSPWPRENSSSKQQQPQRLIK